MESWPERERQRLPVLVILRDFARWLEERDTDRRAEAFPALFCDYLRHDLERRKLDFAWPLLNAALDRNAQVFLDGLDEVPLARRPLVLATVAEFARRYGRSWLLVTCRVASYERAEWQLPGDHFISFELVPFTDDQIKGFVSAWYQEMAERWNEPRERTRELAARLQEALRGPDLRRLARNPLLLTVMALVHTHDKVLPDHRAVLYERTIAILLWRWETHKRKEDSGSEPELLAALRAAGCTETDLLVELRRLAFDAHAQGGETDDPEQVEGIGDGVLVKALARLHREQSWDWARSLVELMRQRTGLLVEREPGVFAFPHRTFQEYLAGVHLALSPNFVSKAVGLATSGAFWREVILLAVGYKVHGQGEYDLPVSLLDALCPKGRQRNWRLIRLAGDTLLEMGPSRIERHPTGAESLPRVRQRLAALVEQGQLNARERARAG